jgi:hypothetical protein
MIRVYHSAFVGHSTDQPPSFVPVLLPVWIVTALWDAICASALGVFAYGATAASVWRGVAATAFGPTAFENGAVAVAAGLAVHLAVALTWSALFVAAVLLWPALRRAIRMRGGALAVAALYGPAIWLVMSLAVIPLATGRLPRFGLRWWVQIVAHLPFVTLPLVFTTRWVLERYARGDVSARAV